MNEILIFITAIVFLFIGRYTAGSNDLESAKKMIEKRKPVQGVTPKTKEELRKEQTGEKEVEGLMSGVFNKK